MLQNHEEIARSCKKYILHSKVYETLMTTSPARLALITSTTGVGALTAWSALLGEPGLAVIGALSLGWGALATSGVCLPSLEMYEKIAGELADPKVKLKLKKPIKAKDPAGAVARKIQRYRALLR